MLQRIAAWPAVARAGLVLAIIVIVGILDYTTGREVLLSTFYLVAVALATWTLGRGFAVLAALLSIGAWLAGDRAAGAKYSSAIVPVWNGSITMLFYLVVIWLLSSLLDTQHDLEDRVRQRTVALTEEMADRERLEREILEIGQRERRRIGHDLHDSLGQHLTGTALASRVLEERLRDQSLAEATDASRIVSLLEQAIELTRTLSHGLDPIEVEGGLAEGLRELARSMSGHSPARCEFRSNLRSVIDDPQAATHLYRIAQEAISNAINHGHARHILLLLEETPGGRVRMTVTDDGVGIPEPAHRRPGMGLRVMARRAAMIGGSFWVARQPDGGTVVRCEYPSA